MKQMVSVSKRILCLLLAVCMVFSLLDVTALAEQTDELTNPAAVEEPKAPTGETEEDAAEAVLVTEDIEEEAVEVTEVIPEAAQMQEEQEENVNDVTEAPAEAEEAVEEEPVPQSEPDIMPLAMTGYDGEPTIPAEKAQSVGADVKAYTFGTGKLYDGKAIPLSDCLYTFHRQQGANDYIITCAVGSEWNRGFLHLLDDGFPTRTDVTTPQVITVAAAGSAQVGEFTFSHNGGHTLVYSRWNIWGKLGGDDRENQKHFRLYRPAKSGEESVSTDIPGYVRITNLTDIQNGGQYLIIKQQTRNTNETAYSGRFFAVHPSASRSNKNDHVVLVSNAENADGESGYLYKKSTTTESVILTAGKEYSTRILDDYSPTASSLRSESEFIESGNVATNREKYFDCSVDSTNQSINEGYARLYDGSKYNGETILLRDCLYTFTNTGSGWKIKGRNKLGADVYLNNFSESADGIVQTTDNTKKVIIEAVSGSSAGKFRFKTTTNGKDEYLWFSKWNIFKYFYDSRTEDYTYFSIYRPVSGNEPSSIELPGYVEVTKLNADAGISDDKNCIKSGSQYLIVKHQTRSDSTGYGQYFLLHPSTELKIISGTNFRNSHVARATAKTARYISTVTFTGKASSSTLKAQGDIPGGTIPMLVGSRRFDVQVYSNIAPTVTPYNTVFVQTSRNNPNSVIFDKDTDNPKKEVPVSRLILSTGLTYGLGVFAPENLSELTEADKTSKDAYDESTTFSFNGKQRYLDDTKYAVFWYSTNPAVVSIENVEGKQGATDNDAFAQNASAVKVKAETKGMATIGVYVKSKTACKPEDPNLFTYSMPVIVVNSSTQVNDRYLDAHIWRVEDTTPFYSLNCSADLTELQLYDAMYVSSETSKGWAMDFFGCPAPGYALTNLSNAGGGDSGHYFPIENDRTPDKTTFYTHGGAAAQNQTGIFGKEAVQNMIQAAMNVGCEGAAGYTRWEGQTGTVSVYMSFVSKPLPRYAKELHGLLHKLSYSELHSPDYICPKIELDAVNYIYERQKGDGENEYLTCTDSLPADPTNDDDWDEGENYFRQLVDETASTYRYYYKINDETWVEKEHKWIYKKVADEYVKKWGADSYLYVSFENNPTQAREVDVGDTVCFKVYLKASGTNAGQLINYSNVKLKDTLDGTYFMAGDPSPHPKEKNRAQDSDWSNITPTGTITGTTTKWKDGQTENWKGDLDSTSGATLRPSHANATLSLSDMKNELDISADLNLRTGDGDNDYMVGRVYEFYIAYEVKKTDFGKDIVNTLELEYSYKAKFSEGELNNSVLAAAPNIKVRDYQTGVNHIVGASLNVGSTLDINFYAYPIDKNGLAETDMDRYFMIFHTEDGEEVRVRAHGAGVTLGVGAEEKTAYPFTYHGVYAYQMPDEITAYFCRYTNDNKADYDIYGVRTYSVTAYAKRMLKQTAEEAPTDANLRSMLVDMLNYGTAAQRFARDNGWDKVSETDATDGVTNEMLTNGDKRRKGEDDTYYSTDNIRQIALDTVKDNLSTYIHSTTENTKGEDPPVHFDKVSLRLEEGMGMTLNATFTLNGVEMDDCTLYLRSSKEKALPDENRSQVGDKYQVTVSKDSFNNQGAGTFAVEIKGVPSFFWGEPYELVVHTNSGEDYTLHYSVMSYCYEMMRANDSDAAKEGWTECLDELLKAMYVYEESSKVWYAVSEA